jgi:hypothetical protein
VILVSLASVTLITALNVKVFNVRYLMCAFPIFVALLAYGLPGGRGARFAVAAAACAVMIVSDANYHLRPEYAREDVRGAARVVTRDEAAGDLILAPGVEEVFAHYYRGMNRVAFIEPARLGAALVDGEVAKLFASHPRIWYLRARSWDKDPDGILARALPLQGVSAASWEFPGAGLVLYARRSVAPRTD